MQKELLVGAAETGGEIILFGFRVKVDPMRKCVSLNNLSEYEQPDMINNEAAKVVGEDSAYASADDVLLNQSSSSGAGGSLKERKRGVPWTEEEHKLFLLGLQKAGKGDWRGISRNFVKSRTPTQVASHAQKYFLRKNNLNRRRRRSSLFDITTDSVSDMPMKEFNDQEDNNLTQQVTAPISVPTSEPPSMSSNISSVPPTPFQVNFGQMMLPVQNPVETMKLGKLVDLANNGSPVLVLDSPIPSSSSTLNVDLNLNHRIEMESTELSLELSLSTGQGQSSSTRQTTFQLMPRFSSGDSMIRVA